MPLFFLNITETTTQLPLHGLYEPEPVPFTFETIGWPILAAVLVILSGVIIFFQIRKYIRNRYRREALEILKQNDIHNNFNQVFIVLKSVAIHAFGREKVASLHGNSWLDFLEQTGKKVHFQSHSNEIETLLYQQKQPEDNIKTEILDNAKQWIKTHAAL